MIVTQLTMLENINFWKEKGEFELRANSDFNILSYITIKKHILKIKFQDYESNVYSFLQWQPRGQEKEWSIKKYN